MKIHERMVKMIDSEDLMEFTMEKMSLISIPDVCDDNDSYYFYALVNPKGLTDDEIFELKEQLDSMNLQAKHLGNLLRFLIEQRHLVVGNYLVRVSW